MRFTKEEYERINELQREIVNIGRERFKGAQRSMECIEEIKEIENAAEKRSSIAFYKKGDGRMIIQFSVIGTPVPKGSAKSFACRRKVNGNWVYTGQTTTQASNP